MAEVKKEAPAKTIESLANDDGLIKVTNVSKGDVNLANGSIEPGKEGMATIAEFQNYAGKYLKGAK